MTKARVTDGSEGINAHVLGKHELSTVFRKASVSELASIHGEYAMYRRIKSRIECIEYHVSIANKLSKDYPHLRVESELAWLHRLAARLVNYPGIDKPKKQVRRVHQARHRARAYRASLRRLVSRTNSEKAVGSGKSSIKTATSGDGRSKTVRS